MLDFFRKKKKEAPQEPKAPPPLLTGGDAVPKGLQHSVIPIEYLGIVKNNWDHENKLFTNQLVIKN